MINLVTCLNNFLEKLVGPKPIYEETPVHNEPWNGTLDLESYMKCTAVNGSSNKFKKVSSFLMNTFLKNQDLEKIRVDNFDPISRTILNQPQDLQKTTINELVANLNKGHLMQGVGALHGCFASEKGVDERPEVVERRLPSFGKLVYLNALANKLKFLGSDESGVLTSDGRNIANKYNKIIKEILDYDTILLNDRIKKVAIKNSLYRRPREDTNIEDLKSL